MVEISRPIRFSRQAKFITVGILILLAVLLLRSVTHVLLPFVWAIITAYIFNPLITLLARRTKVKRFWWVLTVFLGIVGAIVLLVTALAPIIGRQYSELVGAIPGFIDQARLYVEQQNAVEFGGLRIDLKQIEEEVFKVLSAWATELPAAAPNIVVTVIEGLIHTLVYLVVTFYLLLDAERIIASFYALIPAPYRSEIRALVHSIDRVLGAYIRGQLMLIGIMSGASFIVLSILQVKFALVIAIATGILEIIPIIGPYAATTIAALVAYFQGTTPFGWEPWLLALVVILCYFALRQFEDHVIIPALLGHIVDLHPVLVIFAILAGGTLAGALGLLIAIPVAAVIKIIVAYLYSKLIDAPPEIESIDSDRAQIQEQEALTPAEAMPSEQSSSAATS